MAGFLLSDNVSICVENSLMTYVYKIVIRRWNQRLASDDQDHYRLQCVCNTSSLTLTPHLPDKCG